MKAIITKYIGATNTMPSRVKAMASGVKPLVISWDQAENHSGNTGDTEDVHRFVAQMLCKRQDWDIELVGGGLPDSTGYAFCFRK